MTVEGRLLEALARISAIAADGYTVTEMDAFDQIRALADVARLQSAHGSRHELHESRSPDGDGQSEVERVVSSEGQADVTPISPQAGDQRSKVQSDQQPVGAQGHGGKPLTVNAGGRVTEQYEPQPRRPRPQVAGSNPADSHTNSAHGSEQEGPT